MNLKGLTRALNSKRGYAVMMLAATAILIVAGVTGLVSALHCNMTPAQRVSSEASSLGFIPHNKFQARAAVVLAETICDLRKAGYSKQTIVNHLSGQGMSPNQVTSFATVAIQAYCPKYSS
jgi:hypothetical protein